MVLGLFRAYQGSPILRPDQEHWGYIASKFLVLLAPMPFLPFIP